MDGLPTVMIVNTALKGYAEADEFPYHVRIAVGYQSNDALLGLPTPKEIRTLESLEDSVLAAVRKAGTGHYIGNTSWNGVREYNFYVDEPEAVDARLEKLAEQQHRPIQYEIQEDPDWERVTFFFDYDQ
nr:DUF695 domain-containing protein [Cerasicoccus arenae]